MAGQQTTTGQSAGADETLRLQLPLCLTALNHFLPLIKEPIYIITWLGTILCPEPNVPFPNDAMTTKQFLYF